MYLFYKSQNEHSFWILSRRLFRIIRRKGVVFTAAEPNLGDDAKAGPPTDWNFCIISKPLVLSYIHRVCQCKVALSCKDQSGWTNLKTQWCITRIRIMHIIYTSLAILIAFLYRPLLCRPDSVFLTGEVSNSKPGAGEPRVDRHQSSKRSATLWPLLEAAIECMGTVIIIAIVVLKEAGISQDDHLCCRHWALINVWVNFAFWG